jgi:hypothetical protein
MAIGTRRNGSNIFKPDLKGAKIGEKNQKLSMINSIFILKQIKLKHVNPWVTKAPDF